MSMAWDVRFREKPKLEELDSFMMSLGFKPDDRDRKGKFTRAYMFLEENTPREILFFYNDGLGDYVNDLFKERSGEVSAYGSLVTYRCDMTYPNTEDRLRIIEEKSVKTQHDHYRHLTPEYLKWYETALALRDHYNAIVMSEQTSDEINPDKVFPEK